MNVSTQSLRFLTQKLRAHRKASRTRWRVLSSHQQALMVLAHLRKGETYRDLAVGSGRHDDRVPVPARGPERPGRLGAHPRAGHPDRRGEGLASTAASL